MNRRLGIIVVGLLVLLAGCAPVAVQQPPASTKRLIPTQNPDPDPNPNPDPNSPCYGASSTPDYGSQRWQHAWGKAMEGLALGGAVGGLYGAGGGLVLGLIAGLVMADSHYGAVNSQIQSEQQKDRDLEAAIEQELERQRALEGQVAQASTPNCRQIRLQHNPYRTSASHKRQCLKQAAKNHRTTSQLPPGANLRPQPSRLHRLKTWK